MTADDDRFIFAHHPARVGWRHEEAAWEVRRTLRDGRHRVLVTRDDHVVADLTLAELWDLFDAVGVLFDGDASPPARATREPSADGPAQQGSRWAPEDDAALITAWRDGATLAALADALQRTTGAIAARLVRVGEAPSRDHVRDEDRRRR